MKKGKGKISDLLHDMFSVEAIKSAALIEMLEDTQYLLKNNIWDDDLKQKQMYDECESLGIKDGGKTLNNDNLANFRESVKEILYKNKGIKLYDGLTETEQFAIRRLFYISY